MSFPPGLLDAFETARSSIFRLETLQHYAGDPQFDRFQAGLTWQDNASKDHWCDIVRRRRADGVTMQRVHLITHPLTDYVRFELAWSYPPNVAAGEDVRIALDGAWTFDFWMFDDRQVWVMRYDTDGSLLRVEDASGIPTTVVLCREWKRQALAGSHSLTTQEQPRAS